MPDEPAVLFQLRSQQVGEELDGAIPTPKAVVVVERLEVVEVDVGQMPGMIALADRAPRPDSSARRAVATRSLKCESVRMC
jgi:hypothetical protein